jgi:hypothetical protein
VGGVRIGAEGEGQQIVHERRLSRAGRAMDEERSTNPAALGAERGHAPRG